MQNQGTSKLAVSLTIFGILALGLIGYAVYAATHAGSPQDQQGALPPQTTTFGTSSGSTTTVPVAGGNPAQPVVPASPVADTGENTSKYKDGTYSATGSYVSPGGPDNIGVTLTLSNGVVTSVTATPMPHDPTSARYQQKFMSGYHAQVVGKNIYAIDLAEVAASTVSTFAKRAGALGVNLEVSAPAPVRVNADRGSLTQVAVNLIDNALRHTPADGRVVVEVRREGAEAVLRVRDTGTGIPYADLPRVFERFYVVDRSRAREHTGTGLGLAIAKHMVEAHAGTLVAESVYGQGASFTVRIPATPNNIKER